MHTALRRCVWMVTNIEDVPYQDAFFEAVGVITTGGLSAGVIDTETDAATKIVLGFSNNLLYCFSKDSVCCCSWSIQVV